MTPPPNPSLAELATVVGEDNVRNLVRTFLREFPASLQLAADSDRKQRHRLVHSMKSSARVVGAHGLSARLATLEERLADATAPELAPPEIEEVAAEFETIARPLRAFVGA